MESTKVQQYDVLKEDKYYYIHNLKTKKTLKNNPIKNFTTALIIVNWLNGKIDY